MTTTTPNQDELDTMRTPQYQAWRTAEIQKDTLISFSLLMSGIIGAIVGTTIPFVAADLRNTMLMLALTTIFAVPIIVVIFGTKNYKKNRKELWNIREDV